MPSIESLRLPLLQIAAAAVVCASSPAAAEMQLSLYSGYQTAPHSTVDVTNSKSFVTGWEGKSFSTPPYYGVRGTWWLENFKHPNIGLSIDFSHSKVYADDETLRTKTPGWTHFEFTDGLNLLTANAIYRFQEPGRAWTPYLGVGAGINVPHVEVTRPSGKTFDYQVGGATLQALAGIEYKLTENWGLFAEYKGNYSLINVDIDSGDKLKTRVLTNAVNIGVNYHW